MNPLDPDPSPMPSLHERRLRRSVRRAGVAVLWSTLLGGCTTGPDYRAPEAASPSTYTAGTQPTETARAEGAGGLAQRIVGADSVTGTWWRTFGSADLDRLVEEALRSSPTVQQARMRLEQARQDYLAQAGTMLPQVQANARAARENQIVSSGDASNPGSLVSAPPYSLYSATVSVTYAVDLFGANRRALEGMAAQADYQRYQLEAAHLALAGNVVSTTIRRASLLAQLALSERILAAQTRQLDIAGQRHRLGLVPEVEMLSQRTQVEQTRASLAPLRLQIAQAEHQLSVYLGRPPAQALGAVPALDALGLPSELPLTLPAAMARSRPDIRASEALLRQAYAAVGVATANLYPKLTLSGSVGPQGVQLSDMASLWSLGAGLVQPIFNGGQLRARQASAEQAYEAAVATYRQTVLEGLQQVADALRAIEQHALELAARDRAQRDAEKVAQIARTRYASGMISQLALLDAQRQELQTTLDRTRVHAQRLTDTAALFVALGAAP